MSATATAHQTTSGFELLREVLVNDAIGVQPSILLKRVEEETGVNVADLKASAVSSDRFEQQALSLNALEAVAEKLGRVEGERQATRLPLSSDGLRALSELLEEDAAVAPSYGNVVDAFRRGAFAAFSAKYVERTHPAEAQRQRAEIRIVKASGDLSLAESVVSEARGSAKAAGDDLDARAIAASHQMHAEDAANAAAREMMLQRIGELAAREPHLQADMLIERTRMEVRASGIKGAEAQAVRRAGWMPLERSAIMSAIRQGQVQAQLVAPAHRTAAGRW